VRTVTVELIAKVQVYKREMDSAGKSTRGVKEELQEVAKAGKASAVANETVARSMKDAGDAADKAGADFDKMGKDASHLDKRIHELRGGLKDLFAEFDRAGDIDILKKIKIDQRELGQLNRLKKQMSSLFDDVDKDVTSVVVSAAAHAGSAARKGLLSSLGEIGSDIKNSLGAAKAPAIAGAVALGLAISPFLGAAIASAVLGAAGTGGLIGGIVAASQDQRVQEEAKRIGLRIADSLIDAGGAFVDPLIESLRQFDLASDRLATHFAAIGESLAPVMVPLAKGLTGFVDELMPGFVRSMEAAKPVIRALANELPEIGAALSDFFDTISEDPDGAIMAVKALSQIIQGTIRFTGNLLATLSSIFENTQRWGIALADIVNELAAKLGVLSPILVVVAKILGIASEGWKEQVDAIAKAKDASGDYAGGIQPIIRAQEEVAEVTKTATQAIEDQISAMDKMFGRWADSRKLARNYQEAIDDLTDSVKKHGNSLDRGTAAGRANEQALDNLAQSIIEVRNNTIETTGDVYAANTVYYQQVEALRQQALRLGLSKEAANQLAAELRGIPGQVETEVSAPGLLDALNRARELNRLLGSISAGARARAGDTSGYLGGRRWGGITEHAQSGLLRDAGIYSPKSPARYAFAEPATRGEAFVPKSGNYARSMSILSQAAGWYGASVVPGGGGGVQTVVHEHRHTITIQGRELISGFRRAVDLSGGSADDLVGRRRT
jgi:hypothetical protein